MTDIVDTDNETLQLDINNLAFNRVVSTEPITIDEPVFQLEIENTHDYQVQTGIAHNGGGKRKGAFAVYLEPWHADVLEFLDLKKNHGKEEMRARDLFYALWIPDLFMERVNKDEHWTLMCPDKCPDLFNVYDDFEQKAFTELYTEYERQNKGNKTIKARDLWLKILESQIETGTPYMLYKDAANRNSNQKNLGTIRNSNLCTEIIEYSSPDEQAVCNLASIGLPKFLVKQKNKYVFDYKQLFEVTSQITKNLNQVIDINLYPTEQTKTSNFKHRPIGIGVQGLADVFALLQLPFTSDEAKLINRNIFETIYFAFLSTSCELSKVHGAYESFQGSPLSKGVFHFEMFKDRSVGIVDGVLDITNQQQIELSGMYDWEQLRKDVVEYGVRNSLGLAPMPTASTSQILGNNECFEPYTFNIYKRRVLSGEYTIINKHLVNDLDKLGLWDEQMKQQLIAHNGSVQNIMRVPSHIKAVYKTAYELSQRDLIDMAAERQCFIDQSQSFNLFVEDPKFTKLTNIHLYGWLKGLKTGSYYIRTQAAVDPIKGLGTTSYENQQTVEAISCSIDNPEDCEACGS